MQFDASELLNKARAELVRVTEDDFVAVTDEAEEKRDAAVDALVEAAGLKQPNAPRLQNSGLQMALANKQGLDGRRCLSAQARAAATACNARLDQGFRAFVGCSSRSKFLNWWGARHEGESPEEALRRQSDRLSELRAGIARQDVWLKFFIALFPDFGPKFGWTVAEGSHFLLSDGMATEPKVRGWFDHGRQEYYFVARPEASPEELAAFHTRLLASRDDKAIPRLMESTLAMYVMDMRRMAGREQSGQRLMENWNNLCSNWFEKWAYKNRSAFYRAVSSALLEAGAPSLEALAQAQPVRQWERGEGRYHWLEEACASWASPSASPAEAKPLNGSFYWEGLKCPVVDPSDGTSKREWHRRGMWVPLLDHNPLWRAYMVEWNLLCNLGFMPAQWRYESVDQFRIDVWAAQDD